ncbi:hypothetical protein BO82DRAFT_144070 [Aspergillus uvarum CBS 121591]|uniref:Uncharacterized protein n=1 Tax=Aspergillus uvarum CBS 121591 TaxID=1448315 RepID=A0A319CK46_9EURO|nr:hypothetical protein BO82DRAFT_144070 [Aspergillus uvarum CBS 121591]PYH85986.1 hypothetical protein BO82DRAFT_144070 [Aspergillus uvarum CBS 121591]
MLVFLSASIGFFSPFPSLSALATWGVLIPSTTTRGHRSCQYKQSRVIHLLTNLSWVYCCGRFGWTLPTLPIPSSYSRFCLFPLPTSAHPHSSCSLPIRIDPIHPQTRAAG